MNTYAQRLEAAVDYLVIYLQVMAPKDTGNLALAGIRKALNPDTGNYQIVIGGELAPYAVYTNEEWTSPKWNGARNPNQGWVENAIEEAKPTLIAILSGTITTEELNEMLMKQETDLSNIFIEKATI